MKLKKYYTLALALCLSQFFFAQDNSLNSSPAVQYSDKIVKLHNNFAEQSINFVINTVHSDDAVFKEKERQKLISEINKNLAEIKKMDGFEGDTKLRDEAVGVFELYSESYTKTIDDIEILKKNKNTSYEAMDAYLKAEDKLEKKLDKASSKFKKAHKDFSQKNNITLVADESNNEIVSKIAQTNEYSRIIFLEFFRVLKSSEKVIEAINASKPNAIESTRKALINDSEKSMEALKGLKPLNGDKVLKKSVVDFTKYHNEIAQEQLKKVVEILKSDNKTQADIDYYNNHMQSFMKKRNELINAYNNAEVEMKRKNIPNQK